MTIKKRSSRLRSMSAKGFRGYPVATIAFYGPDDKRASKVAVGIIAREDGFADPLRRWFSDVDDVRSDRQIGAEIVAFIHGHKVRSVVMADRIIGCPHEEGKDYPDGETCPRCPFWANRDRWMGEMIQ